MINGYVPWDIKYLTDFYNWIVSAIGSATNIGITAFGIILAILVAVAVVRKFTK